MRTDLENLLAFLIASDWHNGASGRTDEAGGHLAIIDLVNDREIMAAMAEAEGVAVPPHLPKAWAVVVEDDHGSMDITWTTETRAKKALADHEGDT